jgi:hypothetical protein
MADVNFGQIFTQISGSSVRSQFDVQFSQIQNTLIRRVNDEIDKLSDDPSTDRKLSRLRAEGQKLLDVKPVIDKFLSDFNNTQETVKEISDKLGGLNDFLGADDSVTQEEVDAFVAERDIIADKINNLYVFSNVDIPNFDSVKNLKDQLDSFKALTPVVGTKADNSAVTEGVIDLTTRSFNAEFLISNTIEQALDTSLNIQREFADIDIDILEIETVAFSEKEATINDLKADSANLLQIFALAFEGQAAFAENLANSLRPQVPAPGSILNIFT